MLLPLHDILAGMKKAIPIVLGYLPLGFAYGALARHAGIDLRLVVLMSLVVFAGSGQFISVSMLASGAGGASIVATVFLVNLRHLLMSASLSPNFQRYPRRALPLLSFWLTDESFAMASAEFREQQRGYLFMLGLFGTAYAGWVTGSAIGALFGGYFRGVTAAITMEYALYAMFIFLLVIQINERRLLAAAFVSGALSLIFYLYIPGSWYIMLATILTATMGVLAEKWKVSS